MTEIVCDASVALKWFVGEGEDDLAASHSLLDSHRDGRLTALVLDLTLHEIANALLRGRGRPSGDVATVIEALAEICPVVSPDPPMRRLAARLAVTHALTFYDAAYAAVAQYRGAPLATADRQLVGAGLGEAPGEIVKRFGLPSG